MSRNVLFLVIGMLVVGFAVVGYMLYEERQSGVSIEIGGQGVRIDGN
ncbi:MAG: hypothetical protein MEP57_07495 [Microvirga sp.]|nr:hypothetical protein [Microvirga sp.]